MTDEQIKAFMILKYGSFNAIVDQWIACKIELSNNEKRIVEEHVVKVMTGVILQIELKEHPRRAEVVTISGKDLVHGPDELS